MQQSFPIFRQHCKFLRGADVVEKPKLVLVFQVNCPGCFSYALPIASRLEEKIDVVCIATAFEDFELNTLENLNRLLERGETVGETKKHFAKFALTLKNVAFDELVPNDLSNLSEQVEKEFAALIKESPQYRAINPSVLMAAIAKVFEEHRIDRC